MQSGPAGTYTYSARGNRDSGAGSTYSYDGLDQLTNQDAIAYSYDGLGRLASRNAESFSYAGAELDPTTAGNESYQRGPSGDLLGITKDGASSFAGLNRHGDLTYLANGAGAVSDTKAYDPFGKVSSKTGTTNPAL